MRLINERPILLPPLINRIRQLGVAFAILALGVLYGGRANASPDDSKSRASFEGFTIAGEAGSPVISQAGGSQAVSVSSYRASTFIRQSGTVEWEIAGIMAAVTATRVSDVTKGGSRFHFKSEGWFGKNTESLGMDKVHHGWKTYVFTDVLQSIIEHRTGDKRGAAYTATLLALGITTYTEVLDGFTARTGFSKEDMVTHFVGAGASLLRNTVPGLRDKIDFRMEMRPSSKGSDLRLVNQLAQRKYLTAIQLSGFKSMERGPARFIELQFGYYGRGFTEVEKKRGADLKRKLFVGIGLNVQEMFPKNPRSIYIRAGKGIFDYFQLPYTSVRN